MAESVLHTMLFSYLVNVRNKAYSFEESIFSSSQVASWFSLSKYWFIANCWPPVHCSISWASYHTSWCVWWSLIFYWSFLYMFSFSCRLCLSSQHQHMAQYCTQMQHCSTAAANPSTFSSLTMLYPMGPSLHFQNFLSASYHIALPVTSKRSGWNRKCC